MRLIETALAQGAEKLRGLDQTADSAGFVEKLVTDFTGSALRIVISFVGILFLVLMIYGGVIWMTAAGNDTQVSKARKLLVAGVIGLIIVLSAFVITAFVGDQFGPQLIQDY